jgi:Mg/Co/Ni transporter MgtE
MSMASVNRVYAARLAGMVVLGPDGESVGRVRDIVVSISIVRQQPRVLGLAVELPTRRRIFVPILRVTAIEPDAVTLTTGNVSLRRFTQRPGEVLVLGQVLDTRVRVNDPEHEEFAGVDVVVVDLGIEQTRTRDWVVTRVAVRGHRRLGRRGAVVWRNRRRERNSPRWNSSGARSRCSSRQRCSRRARRSSSSAQTAQRLWRGATRRSRDVAMHISA